MNQQELIYWIQGMLEYTEVSKLSHEDALAKLQGIKDHLGLVLTKVTPVTPGVIDKVVNKQDKKDPNKELEEYIKKFQKEVDTPKITPKWGDPFNPNKQDFYCFSPDSMKPPIATC